MEIHIQGAQQNTGNAVFTPYDIFFTVPLFQNMPRIRLPEDIFSEPVEGYRIPTGEMTAYRVRTTPIVYHPRYQHMPDLLLVELSDMSERTPQLILRYIFSLTDEAFCKISQVFQEGDVAEGTFHPS
jgi:hypothetical protein